MALLEAQAQGTFLQTAALQVGGKLRLDVVGQAPACLGAQLTEAIGLCRRGV